MRILRALGVMIGSITIAYLALALFAGAVFGDGAPPHPLVTVAAFILGGVVFADIMRRGRSTTWKPARVPRQRDAIHG